MTQDVHFDGPISGKWKATIGDDDTLRVVNAHNPDRVILDTTLEQALANYTPPSMLDWDDTRYVVWHLKHQKAIK
jgi:hypothetical protein